MERDTLPMEEGELSKLLTLPQTSSPGGSCEGQVFGRPTHRASHNAQRCQAHARDPWCLFTPHRPKIHASQHGPSARHAYPPSRHFKPNQDYRDFSASQKSAYAPSQLLLYTPKVTTLLTL